MRVADKVDGPNLALSVGQFKTKSHKFKVRNEGFNRHEGPFFLSQMEQAMMQISGRKITREYSEGWNIHAFRWIRAD